MSRPKIKHKAKERCHYCHRRARGTSTCITCERLGKEEPFVRHSCNGHVAERVADVRRHALVGHPVNILRAGIAALKGEDIS